MALHIVEFDLKSKSPVTVKNGDVIVDKGYSTVTVRNVEASSWEDAQNKARPKADAFLNELCLRVGITLELGTNLTVAPQDSPETRHIKRFWIKAKTTGGHRQKIPSMLEEVAIGPSQVAKSHFRKAALSEDTFDKFRNLYLAIENVASAIWRENRAGKIIDSKLLECALPVCFSSNVEKLEDYALSHGFELKGDAITCVAELLYNANRLELFHSKEGMDKKTPFDPKHEWEVQRVLPLAEFVAKSLLCYEDTHL